MAIYHLNAKVISRGKGKSATAAAAYRAAEKIRDERTGMTFDYSRRKGVYATEIIAPAQAPNWVSDRERLWNEAELAETRKNSRTAREFDIALPVELNHEESQELVRGFVKEQLVSQSLVADLAFHHLDSHNPHVHIMVTTRKIEFQGFGAKERNLDRKDFLLGLRQSWEVHANRALERAGTTERLDRRTLEEQGINRIPQIHLGPDVAAMMQRGIATERSEKYLSIQVANEQIEALERKITALEKTIETEEHLTQSPDRDKRGKHPIAGEFDSPRQITLSNTESQLEPSLALTQSAWKPLTQNELSQIFLTSRAAIERYGRESNHKTTFKNTYYQIQKFSVFETYGYRSYLTIDALDGRGRLLTMKGQNFHPANLKVEENRLSRQDVKQFGEIQTALDYLQQVRQLKRDAEFLLSNYGIEDPQKDGKVLEGKKYRLFADEQALRIIAFDGRGEILNYPNERYTSYPEVKAQTNFTSQDVELFRELAYKIEQQQREASKQWKRQRERGRGFER